MNFETMLGITVAEKYEYLAICYYSRKKVFCLNVFVPNVKSEKDKEDYTE